MVTSNQGLKIPCYTLMHLYTSVRGLRIALLFALFVRLKTAFYHVYVFRFQNITGYPERTVMVKVWQIWAHNSQENLCCKMQAVLNVQPFYGLL